MGRIPLGPEIAVIVKEALGLLSGPDSELVADVLERSYTPSATYGSAFAGLFARIFAMRDSFCWIRWTIACIGLAAPVMRLALEQRDELKRTPFEARKRSRA